MIYIYVQDILLIENKEVSEQHVLILKIENAHVQTCTKRNQISSAITLGE